MIVFIVRRIFQTFITLLTLSVIVFIITMQLPGDPALALLGEQGASQELIEHYRDKLGLNQPIYIQYFKWLQSFVKGELGRSIRYKAPVSELFAQRLPVTLQLLIMGIFFALIISVPLGIISAILPNTRFDNICTIVAVSGVSIPGFFTGIILIFIFSIWLRWLPSAGYTAITEDFWMNIKSTLMPSFALGIALSAELMRHLRSSFLETFQEDYIRTARAKGLKEYKVILKHAGKNSLIPVITLLGMRIGRLIGGVVVIEEIFVLPGVGRLLMSAVLTQDYPVIQTGIILIAFVVVVLNLITDICYSYLDPRVRY
jgi:peptide/nickel transport system permease protein